MNETININAYCMDLIEIAEDIGFELEIILIYQVKGYVRGAPASHFRVELKPPVKPDFLDWDRWMASSERHEDIESALIDLIHEHIKDHDERSGQQVTLANSWKAAIDAREISVQTNWVEREYIGRIRI